LASDLWRDEISGAGEPSEKPCRSPSRLRYARRFVHRIFHEISCSVEVRGNVLRDNGDDGLFVHSSIDADVHHNTFGGNGDAAVEIKDNLTRKAECASNAGAYGNRIHENTLNGDAVKGCVAPRNEC
jgi:hypothetical protein